MMMMMLVIMIKMMIPLYICTESTNWFSDRPSSTLNFWRHSAAHSGSSVQLTQATFVSFHFWSVFSSCNTRPAIPSKRTVAPLLSFKRFVPSPSTENGAPPPHSLNNVNNNDNNNNDDDWYYRIEWINYLTNKYQYMKVIISFRYINYNNITWYISGDHIVPSD